MTATTHKLEFPGAMNRRGFWLYVWRIESPAEGELLYVGRTGDSASPNASSPIARMGQHLGFNKKENMLRRHLSTHGINPEQCTNFEMIAYGPVFPEQKEWYDHKKLRNKIAALEKDTRRDSAIQRIQRDEHRHWQARSRTRPLAASPQGVRTTLPQIEADPRVISKQERTPTPASDRTEKSNMPTDTSEKGLEARTVNLLQESGWLPGDNQDYSAASCVDLAHLTAFLHDTQPETAQALPPGLRRHHPAAVPTTRSPAGPGPGQHRRAPERHRARSPQHPPLLRGLPLRGTSKPPSSTPKTASP